MLSGPGASGYSMACSTVKAYVQWIESQSLPAGMEAYSKIGDVGASLFHIRSDALEWDNKLFPIILELPNTYAVEGVALMGHLKSLSTLALQLKDAGNAADPIKTEISRIIGEMLPSLTAGY
jgi:hypothetical protein